jgi:predicted lipid-binding transport protein (Tim44 family)
VGVVVASVLVGGVGGLRDGSPADLLRVLGVAGALLLLLGFLRGRLATRAHPPVATEVRDSAPPDPAAATADEPGGGSRFARGLRDIRRTDPRFDPARFAGYAGMMFRDAQRAWVARDIGALRDRVTPEMYGRLRDQCGQLLSVRRSNRVEEIEIRAEITQAWQHGGQDFVTAYIDGSVVDYTVDELTRDVVDGSATVPRAVAEFWTFTRPAGLNAWMLAAIHSSPVPD